VAEQLVPDVYRRAVDEAHLSPVEDPEVRDLQLEEGRPLRFTAVIEIKPAIGLGDYRGVTATHTPVALTDADVEAALQNLAERQATLLTVSRPARHGDHVVIDYTIQPEAGNPRTEQGYGFKLGGGRVLPEMEEAALGLAAGDERQVTVRFPADHPREDLRGKSGQLSLRVVEVKEEELPALDDEFARGVSSHQTLGELREAIRTELAVHRERQNRRTLEEAVVDAVLARHDFAVPESLVQRDVANRIGRMQASLSRQGVDPARVQWDYEKLAGELRPAALRTVRWALLQEAIAEKEELTVGEAEVEAEIARLAQDAGRAPQAMRSMLQRSGDLDHLALSLREGKVLKLLVDAARIEAGS
jgi:trigger factor